MDTISYKKVKSAGGIVKDENDKIALIKMSDVEAWDFPKGGIMQGEEFLEAATREIAEETGIKDLKLLKKLPNYLRPAANGNPILIDTYMFLFISKQKTLKPIEKDILEAQWIDKTKVINQLTLPEAKEYFNEIKSEI